MWTQFHPSPHFDDDPTNEIIDSTLPVIVQCFSIPQMAESTLECVSNIVELAPRYVVKLGPGALDALLTSHQARVYIESLRRGEIDPGPRQMVGLVEKLLESHDLSKPDAFEDQSLRIVLATLRSLLYTAGTPGIDDHVSQSVLDMFNRVAEDWGDWVGTSDADKLLSPLIHEGCSRYVIKMQYPPNDSEESPEVWEAHERAQFQDFRHDVQDFLLASYACIGASLIAQLAALLQSPGGGPSWESFEAQLYCLGAFSDVISNKMQELGRYVSDVLRSPKWKYLVQNANAIPDLARQGAISFISRNTSILQHDQEQLLPILNFLFASLQIPGTATSASRAIFVLCQKQRSMLVGALPQFIESIASLADVPSEERQKLFGGVAAIVQALQSEEAKVVPLLQLFGILQQNLETAIAPPREMSLSAAIDLLQTLAAVGKGLRSPPEAPIDLDDARSTEEQNFWIEGAGRELQGNVQNVIDNNLADYLNESALIEAACEILKSGYTESHPSPFKFDAAYSARLLDDYINLDSTRVSVLIDTASAFLAAHSSHPTRIRNEFFQVTSAISACQLAILKDYAAHGRYEDHEFTHSSLEYFTRLLPKYGYFFEDAHLQEAWKVLFEFALLALENPDTLPRRSAAQFWVSQSFPSSRCWADINGFTRLQFLVMSPPSVPKLLRISWKAFSTTDHASQPYYCDFWAVVLLDPNWTCFPSP
jgi:hypothetical protein